MALYIECPSRPLRTLYELEDIMPGGAERHRPVDPGPLAGEMARRKFAKALREHEDLMRRQKAHVVRPHGGQLWICGEDVDQVPPCACGHDAEMLCDYPMGKGKTCDLRVCWCCSKHIAADMDLCLIHFAEFVKKSGVERINPWPPQK